tara:strand:- start:10271 stop:11227 length:957 start_codon:yes stop_codon:yes gene_type:complete
MNRQVAALILNRLGISLISLIIVSFAVFFATDMLPGDVAQVLLGQAATEESVAGLRQAMGLDQPAIIRFLNWMIGLLSGEMGTSYVNNISVSEMIGDRLINSLKLAGVATLISVPLALTAGITAAIYRGRAFDRFISIFTISVVSVPDFMLATASVLVFAVYLKLLPALSLVNDGQSLADILRNYALPVGVLSLAVSVQMIRMTRAAVIDTLSKPYVEMAKLKGASTIRIVLKHALPNAVGPIANAIALSLSSLIGGVVIIETVFNYPGVAKLMVDAVATRDLPLIQSCAMIFCFSYLLLITLADIAGILSNPRLRNQ